MAVVGIELIPEVVAEAWLCAYKLEAATPPSGEAELVEVPAAGSGGRQPNTSKKSLIWGMCTDNSVK